MTTVAQPPTTPKVTLKDRLQQGRQLVVNRARQVHALGARGWLALFPPRDATQEDEESGFLQSLLQVVLWTAFAAFLLASLPHVAYFFAAFEPEDAQGNVSDYWWVISYIIAVSIDVTSYLLSLSIANKMQRATRGLGFLARVGVGLKIAATHWPFIMALVGFSWLVNFEHATQFHSGMLGLAENVVINLIVWKGTLHDLNPVIASAFPVLAVAYTGMSDQIGSQRKANTTRLTTVAPTTQPIAPPTPVSSISETDMQRILSALAEVASLKDEVRQLRTVSVQEVATAPTTPAIPEQAESKTPPLEQGEKDCSPEQKSEQADFNYGTLIADLYWKNTAITVTDVVQKLGCSRSTANKWLSRVRPDTKK